MIFKGQCLCGEVTYQINAKHPEMSGLCHCDDCQRHTGSAFSTTLLVLRKDITFHGPTKSFLKELSVDPENKSNSDINLIQTHRIFCANCGSSLAHQTSSDPLRISIEAGTLSQKDKDAFAPNTELWVHSQTEFVADHFGHLKDDDGRRAVQHNGNLPPMKQ